MHCCLSCEKSWCSACFKGIDAAPTNASDCRSCTGGRVILVPRVWVAALISPDERIPRCGCNRGISVTADAAHEHEMQCPKYLVIVLQEIGALKPGATYTDSLTINALILLAKEHPLP
jgi:hypothetical protein